MNYRSLILRIPIFEEVSNPFLVTPTLVFSPDTTTYPADEYPRSIWDLFAHQYYLFAGIGDSAHNIAAPPVWNTDDGVTWSSVDGAVFDDWQIERFVYTDGRFWIPGHDPLSGTLGNLYLYNGSATWTKSTPASLSAVAHVYDLYKFGTNLWAGVGRSSGSSSVRRSTDGGTTWTNFTVPASGADVTTGRAWTFFKVGTDFFVSTNYVYLTAPPSWSAFNDPWVYVSQFNGTDWIADAGINFAPDDQQQVGYTETFPGSGIFNITSVGRIHRAVTFAGKTVYVVGETITDHDISPTNTYEIQTGETEGTRLTFMGTAKVIDLLVYGNYLFALANELNGDTYTSTLYVTTDLTDWEIVLQWEHADTYTYARSMEAFDNGTAVKLYVGYACYYDNLGAGAGKIVTVSNSDLNSILAVSYLVDNNGHVLMDNNEAVFLAA